MSEPGASDRRRSPRVPMPAEGGAVSVVGGRLVNVSLHGMRIESPVPLEAQQVLRFRLVVAGAGIDVEARVAACDRVEFGRRAFEVGMEFVKIAEPDRERLAAALAQLLPAGGPS